MPRLKCPACHRPFGVEAAPLGAPVQCPYCRTVHHMEKSLIAPESRPAKAPAASGAARPARVQDLPVAAVVQTPAAAQAERPTQAPSRGQPYRGARPVTARSVSPRQRPAAAPRKGGEIKVLAGITMALLLAGMIGLGIMIFNSSVQTPQNPMPVAAAPQPMEGTTRERATRVSEKKTARANTPETEGEAAPRQAATPLAARESEASADGSPELEFSMGTTDQDRKEDSETNRLCVIGLVRNNGARMVKKVIVTCKFFDASDNALTAADGNSLAHTAVEWLAPKTEAKFMILWGRTTDVIKRHKLELVNPEYAEGHYVALPVRSTRITPTDSETGARADVEGGIHNGTGGIVSEVQVIVQVCDGDNHILRTLSGAPTTGPRVSPMQNASFKLSYNGAASEPNFTNPAVSIAKTEVRAFGKVE